MELLPKWEDIPEPFRRKINEAKPYCDFMSQWFFNGADSRCLVAREGVDEAKAARHIAACLCSFAPKHEHKISGCAYLLSQWFELKS